MQIQQYVKKIKQEFTALMPHKDEEDWQEFIEQVEVDTYFSNHVEPSRVLENEL